MNSLITVYEIGTPPTEKPYRPFEVGEPKRPSHRYYADHQAHATWLFWSFSVPYADQVPWSPTALRPVPVRIRPRTTRRRPLAVARSSI